MLYTEPRLEPRERFIPACPLCGEQTETLWETLDHALIGCPICADEAVEAEEISAFDYFGLDWRGRRVW